ncbi:MAG: multiheme c-type cytochrome, partial [Thermoanaerobaculia bacterium]
MPASWQDLQWLMDVEAVAVALVLAAVAVWLARSLGPGRRRLAAIAAALVMVAAGAGTAMLTRTPPVTEADVPLRPIAVPENGFVSSRACRSCHPHEYSAWHDSYHRRMTQVATPETVLGDFGEVTLEYHGDTYVLGHDDEIFWFDLITTDADGEPRRIRRPILLSTGSHHMQAYWYPVGKGRAMEFFAFVYLIPEQRWVPRESIFLQPTVAVDAVLRRPTEFEEWQNNRRWNHSCLHCHTTDGQPRFPEVDTRVAEFGIACEACHGPGEEHVERNRDPLRRYRLHLSGEPDPTILDPSDLAAERGSQVCGVCHGVNYPRGDQVKADFATGHSYRPGADLEATRLICRPDDADAGREPCPDLVLEQRFWSDGMLRVSGREYNGLIESPCFRGGELSCFSCHRMHQGEDDV